MSDKIKTKFKAVWFDEHVIEQWKLNKTPDKTFPKYAKRVVMSDMNKRRLIAQLGD